MIQPASGAPYAAQRSLVASAAAFVRRIIGVPDYAIYKSHMESCHPGEPVMTEREFVEERLAARYSRPGQRCC